MTFNFPQKSPEWFAIRRGRPTCSRFDQILTPKKGEPSSAQETLINELIAEALEEQGEGLTTRAMDEGSALEGEARAAYELEFDPPAMSQVGFVLSTCGRFGGSPDSLVGDAGGLEVKCPIATTQISYLRGGILPTDYRCQVHGYMAVTGRSWWDFYSYRRGLPRFRVRVVRDEFTEKLTAELARFCDRYNQVRVTFGLDPLAPMSELLKKELEPAAG